MMMNAAQTSAPKWPMAAAAIALLMAAGIYWKASQSADEATKRIAALESEMATLKESQKLAPTLVPEQKSSLLENLKPLLKVENEELRARVVEMTALVEPKGADLLLDQVLRTDPSTKVKLITLDVLGKQKMAYGRTEALKLLASDDAALRRKAGWCLGAIGKDTDEETNKKVREGLLRALRSENEQWVKELLAHTERTKNLQGGPLNDKGSEAKPLPIAAYGSHGPYIQALGEVGDKETAKRLQFYLESIDPLVRRETVLALGNIGSDESTAALLACFRAEHDDMVSSSITSVLTGPTYKMKFDAKTKQFVGP